MKFKAMTAIAVTALFLLTALGATVNAQTANAYTPVPYIYGQPSVHAMPYVATSNGLTYTVEPNGTYLWNGHYLRAPPVPYPKVPTIAPDGLPYGAVGPVGAQGHVGPYSFTQGANNSFGVMPDGTSKTNISITTNTLWANSTFNLYSNTTFSGGYTFIIYNSKIIFHEPPSGSAYSFSFGVGDNGILKIEAGSIIESTSNASMSVGDFYEGGVSTETISNTTINMTPYGGGFGALDKVSYSIVNGNDSTNGFGLGQRGNQYSITNTELNNLGMIQATNLTNDVIKASFIRGLTTGSGYWNMSYDTFENFSNIPYAYDPNHMWSWNGPSLYINITNDLFENGNISYFNLVTSSSGRMVVENDTIRNIVGYATSGNGGSMFGTTSFGQTSTIEHLTVINVTGKDIRAGMVSIGGSSVNPFSPSTANNGTIRYNYIDYYNLTGSQTVDPTGIGEIGPFVGSQINYNIFDHFITTYTPTVLWGKATPIGPWSADQVNSAVVGNNSGHHSIIAEMIGNWFLNSQGGNLLAQVQGTGVLVQNNVAIDLNNSMFFGIATSSGGKNCVVTNNSEYGLYNYSVGIGGLNFGEAINTTYKNNTAYDVGIHSFGFETQHSSETWYNLNGAFLVQNYNGTINLNVNNRPILYTSDTTHVTFVNSAVTQLVLYSSLENGLFYSNGAWKNRPIYTSDYNITIENSYIPSMTYIFNGSNGEIGNSFNLFSFGHGIVFNNKKNSNPSFLNLTGYLGIYQGQTYNINTSNIKGESSLPIYMNGYQVAAMSAAVGHYNLTVSTSAGTLKYAISADKTTDQPVTLYWQGQAPNAEYAVAMYDHGSLIDYTNVTSNANGVVTFQYNPATMPLDPVFQLTTFNPVITPINSMFTNSELILTIVAGFAIFVAAAIALGVGQRRSRSSRRRKR